MATIELTEANFETHVKEDDILLVDFWADWCGPCKQLTPIIEAAVKASPPKTAMVMGMGIPFEKREISPRAAAGPSCPSCEDRPWRPSWRHRSCRP